MNKKSIFNILYLALMSFSALFVANLSPYVIVSADSISVVQVSGNKYKDAKGNYYEQTTTLTSGTYTDGTSFSSDATAYFKYEPIVWEVLDYTSGYALVVSNKILANMAFDPANTINDYTKSNIRQWLNGYPTDIANSSDTLNYGSSFYDTAFTPSEQSKILETTLTTNGDATDYTKYSSGTFSQSSPTSADKIFLLSRADATNSSYYTSSTSSSSIRCKQTTDYSVSQGAYKSTETSYLYNGYWWLRSTYSCSSDHTNFVSWSGGLYNDYLWYYYGVAPAMYLDTTGLTFYTDATCENVTTAAAKTYVKFGSYPQTIADCTTTIDIPATGVEINFIGVIFSGIVLIGLFLWIGTIGIGSLKNKKY